MISPENKNRSTPILIITLITFLFGILYLSSTYFSEPRPPKTREEFDYAGRPTQRLQSANQLILQKNERLVVGRNGLVFKGIDKNIVILNLYLLDMDSEQAYEKRFLKKDAKKEMVLGGSKYRLLSVNDKYLTLKIISESSKL